MTFEEIRELQIETISQLFRATDQKQVDQMVDAIMKADRIFIGGFGRAGNVARILGMNCSQLGMLVHCVGDNGTPAISDKDIFIINSGSGNTKTVKLMAEQAKKHGAAVALMTMNPDSEIGAIADVQIVVPVFELLNLREEADEQKKRILFDVFYEVAFILNDYIRSCIMERTGQTAKDIVKNHNNLE